MNYGKGMLEIETFGTTDLYIEKYDETLIINRPKV